MKELYQQGPPCFKDLHRRNRGGTGLYSDHVATAALTLGRNGKQYAIGKVSHKRHNDLILNKWYRVYQNRERSPRNLNTTSWD